MACPCTTFVGPNRETTYENPMSIPIALQLWSVRDDCAADFPAILAKIAEMGYDGVEFAGFHGLTASELRKILGDLGLKIAGSHTGFELLRGIDRKATLDYNEELGNRRLVIPSVPEEYQASLADWRRVGGEIAEIASFIRELDFNLGYHNHDVEFTPIDGALPFRTLFGELPPDVRAQIDVGWVAAMGHDPVETLHEFAPRIETVHIKEFSPQDETAVIGTGSVDFPAVFAQCDAIGVEWAIIEHEHYAAPPLTCVKQCLDNLRGMEL
ncbi:MAG: sugar phosphate isomerase/epimerase [Rhodothermales bacterium]|jgi:sugar phosphate isomerase/epimerase